MFPIVSPKHLFVVSNCAWMFQEEHRFNQALKLKHVVPKKQFPGSLTACILNLASHLLDVGRKGCNDLDHSWIFTQRAMNNKERKQAEASAKTDANYLASCNHNASPDG
jgi:hypothetical protein